MSDNAVNDLRERKTRQGMFFISLSLGATSVVILMLLSVTGYMLLRGSTRLFFSPVVEILHTDGSVTLTELNHNVEFDVIEKDGRVSGKNPAQSTKQFVNGSLEDSLTNKLPVPADAKVEVWKDKVIEVDDPWETDGGKPLKVKQVKQVKVEDIVGATEVTRDMGSQSYSLTLADGTKRTLGKDINLQFRTPTGLINLATLSARYMQENPEIRSRRQAEVTEQLHANVPAGYEPVDTNWKVWELAHVMKNQDGKTYLAEERIKELKPAKAFRMIERWNWFQFFWAFPRNGNTEGGVLPCIFGTVMMTLIMTIIVAPFGIATAVYLREYARENWFTHLIRLAVANLAGVPSIVFGLFGLGFFILTIGRGIDDTFYSGNKVFGTPCVLWASLTMALLTLPVMIVAAEEALRTVPKELREGALALGATKFSSIMSVVIPSALPGILTGIILAVARGAGEVAPLLLTGVVAHKDELPTNPLDKFMDLAYHIYDLSVKAQPNRIEEAQALAFSSALVLVMVVLGMNLLAIWLRARLGRSK
jgi:phosphate transport system permease protein